MKYLMLICLVAFLGIGNLAAQDFEYVGAKKCKMCHNKPATGAQYDKWAESPHAKAMESLNAEEAKDPKCLKCHSTVGGVDASLVATLKMEEGVSCESCHGPGSKYFPNAIMKSREKSMENGLILPTEKVCKTCHNAESPHFKGFNYKEYVAKIAHPVPAA
ncbi:MAG: cytochrome c family protein [Bacteroidales bacterium]|nr:cytochrome c family protein [Bacteroidales bacterium]